MVNARPASGRQVLHNQRIQQRLTLPQMRILSASWPGIAVRRTASLPLAYARPSTVFLGLRLPNVDARGQPRDDDFLRGGPAELGHQKAIIQPLAAVASMIGPNSSQRSPLNFIICNCLLTR